MLRSRWFNAAKELGAVAAFVCLALQTATGAATSDFEKFKKFMETPPVIKHAVLLRYYPANPSFPKKYIHLKWQPDAFLWVESDKPFDENIMPLRDAKVRANCAYKETFWNIDGPGRCAIVCDPKIFPAGSENPVKNTVNASKLWIDQFLNMGLQHVSAASIRWKGDEFNYINYVDGNQFILDGKLIPNENELAGELWVTVTFRRKDERKPNKVTWIWSYTYDVGRPYPFLPSKMTLTAMVNRVRTVAEEIKIIRLELSDVANPPDAFDYHRYLLPDSFVYYSSNQTFYSVEDGVSKERMKTDDPRIVMPKQKNQKTLRVAYIIVAIMLFAPLAFLWKAQRKADDEVR